MITYAERDTVFDSSFHSMYDINKLHIKFFKEPSKENFIKVIKDYIPDSKKLMYRKDIEFKDIKFDISDTDSGIITFDLSTIRNENDCITPIVVFNILNVDVTLRSTNLNIDGKLVRHKSIFTFSINEFRNKK
jgi:hypothetical protein